MVLNGAGSPRYIDRRPVRTILLTRSSKRNTALVAGLHVSVARHCSFAIRLLLFVAVLAVARPADFSSGLIFAVRPLTGRIRPALHTRRPRGRGDIQLVLVVARPADFSSGLFFAVEPLTGRIRPALHARRPCGRGDVQLVLLVATNGNFSSGLILAVLPQTSRIRPARHARRPRGGFDGQLLRRIWNSNDVSRDETACDGSHHAYECR